MVLFQEKVYANLSDAESAKIFSRLDNFKFSLRRHIKVGAGLALTRLQYEEKWIITLETQTFPDNIAAFWYLFIMHGVCDLLHLNKNVGIVSPSSNKFLFRYLWGWQILEKIIVLYGLLDQGSCVEIFLDLK